MERHRYTQCWPRPPADMGQERLIDFNSGYVERALDRIPKQGTKRPWRLYQNYFLDLVVLRHRPIEDGALEFR